MLNCFSISRRTIRWRSSFVTPTSSDTSSAELYSCRRKVCTLYTIGFQHFLVGGTLSIRKKLAAQKISKICTNTWLMHTGLTAFPNFETNISSSNVEKIGATRTERNSRHTSGTPVVKHCFTPIDTLIRVWTRFRVLLSRHTILNRIMMSFDTL